MLIIPNALVSERKEKLTHNHVIKAGNAYHCRH